MLMLSTTGCESMNVDNDIPACIEQEIATMKAGEARNPPASVWQYEYNNQTVYFIPAYCCDLPSVLMDTGCNVLCHPDGGYTGKGDGKCPDFFDERTNEKLVWQDDRE